MSTSTFTSIDKTNFGLEGGEFTITGTNLSTANLVDFKSSGTSIQGVTPTSTTATTIKGILQPFAPTEVGKTLTITVYIQGVPQTTSLTITINAPQLTTLSASSGPIGGGTEVTLNGHYLSGTNQVLFGTIPATIKSTTDTSVVVVTPQGINSGPVNVTANVQTKLSNPLSYSYTLKSNIPLTINTANAGLPTDTPVYMYILGEVKTAGADNFYWVDASGNPTLMSTTDNTNDVGTFPNSSEIMPAAATALMDNYQEKWANFAIPVDTSGSTTINLANINTANIPGLGTGTEAFSGRIYLSVGVPILPFSVTTGGYKAPVFYNGSGQYTLFDWIEFSFDSLQNINANTTMVDQFGLSLTLEVTAPNAKSGTLTKVGLNATTSRNDMIELEAQLYAEGRVIAPSATMVTPTGNYKPVYPSNINFNVGGILRVLSPGQIVANPSISSNLSTYFDSNINAAYTAWLTTPLVVQVTTDDVYSAMATQAGALKFKTGNFSTAAAWNAAPAADFEFADKITTKEIWLCDGTLASGSTASKNVGKVIAASFTRGVASNSMTAVACNVAGFYPSGGVYSQWASIAHQYSLDNLAYGFAYDDVCSQSPSIGISQPDAVEIKIESF